MARCAISGSPGVGSWIENVMSASGEAYKVGYCQPSAFAEMFRRTFETTPKAWILALETLGQRSDELPASVSLALQRTANA
jgi:AraC-like DNA-binding protein